MDGDDVEIIEHDISDNPCVRDVYSDFSEVQIAVHGADVAEKILDNLSDLEAVIENDIQIVAVSPPEHILSDIEYNHDKLHSSSNLDNREILDYPDQISGYDQCSTKDLQVVADHLPEHILSDLEYNNDKLDSKSDLKNNNDTQEILHYPEQIKTKPLAHNGVPENNITYPKHISRASKERYLEDHRHVESDDDIMIIPDECPQQILKKAINKQAVIQDVKAKINNCIDHAAEVADEDIEKESVDCRDDNPQDCTQDCTDFVMIKEEEDQFEATDYTDFDEMPESTNNDLPPEDIYHFNNKIILGSKPSTSNINVKQEKIPDYIDKAKLNADVLLEDCGPNLENDAHFCKKCDILFATPNALDSHNMAAHSFLVAVKNNKAVKSTAKPAFARKSTGTIVKSNKIIDRKSTGAIVKNAKSIVQKSKESSMLTSKFCNHCNKVFADHDALIQHLYELVPSKTFKCNKCDLLFNSQKDLLDHSAVHIKTEKTKVKKEPSVKNVKVYKRKILFEEDIKKKPLLSPKKDANLIPLSALFQCIKCNLHVLGAFAGWQHTIICNGQTPVRKIVACKICKKKLRDVDVDTHQKQHEVCTKFKVFKVTRNLFERILCRCPKCGVHFNELTIQAHYKKCGKLATANCQSCNLLLPKSGLYSHIKKHKKYKLKPKDFVVIQYFVRNKTNMKRKLQPINTPAKKIKLETLIKSEPLKQGKSAPKILGSTIKKDDLQKPSGSKNEETASGKMINRPKLEKSCKYRIFFCKNCKGCCMKYTKRTVHLSKKCKSSKGGVICDECGFLFNKKALDRHKHQIHKTRALSLRDIAFYNISNLKRIIPSSLPKYPQCEDCKIKFFSKLVQKEHICGENYKTCKFCGDKFDNSAYNIHVEFHKLHKTQPGQKLEAKIIPELIKKYESLTMTWSIVFSCTKCDVVTNSYDNAVEHSQDHLYNGPTSKTIKCYICNLKFDETSWSKHSDLHSRMQIGSNDFNILVYDPQTLLSEDWFKLFETLPEDQIKQITDQSMYGYERGIKMKLLKDGLPNLTLYSCSKCNICFNNHEVAKHIMSPCKTRANMCRVCRLPFNDITALTSHEMLHVRGSKRENFRIVSFMKELKAHKRPYAKTEKAPESTTSRSKYVIYKCKSCKTCLRRKYNMAGHRCIAAKRQAKCNICKHNFNRCFMNKHLDEHSSNPDFNIRNISIEYFDSLDVGSHNDKNSEPVQNKSRADRVPKPTKTPSRKIDKVKADTSKTENTGAPKIAKVFKCDCGLHYTSLKTIEKHKEQCSPYVEISQENCSKCGLLFPTDVLVSHLCKHHSNNMEIVVESYKTAREEGFESVESTSKSPTQIRNANDVANSGNRREKVRLFKCSECNIYFVTQNTCYKHVYKNHVPMDARRFIECKLCGIPFTIKTLELHVSRHHQEKLTLDDILVEEYRPRVGKESLKIEIYTASDKLQSRLVTSSVEENRLSI